MSSVELPVVDFSTLVGKNGMQIGLATLQAEKSLHALSRAMVARLYPQLLAWQRDPRIALVVLMSSGEKAFCAGGDLQDLYAQMQHWQQEAGRSAACLPPGQDFFTAEYRLDHLLHNFDKPLLCWGQGIVMGGGIGMMVGASHRVVCENSRLAMPEIGIGLFPDVGGSYFLRRLPQQLGRFLALSGAQVNASDALFAGLADYCLPLQSKGQVLQRLQEAQWQQNRDANHALLHGLLAQMQAAQDVRPLACPLRQHAAQIEAMCAGHDLGQVLQALLSHAEPDPWWQKAQQNIRKACPASLWLSWELPLRAAHMNLAAVLQMELVAALGCCMHGEFAEGIRALIIAKDQRPRWQGQSLDLCDPTRLQMLAANWEARFFKPLWAADQHPLADLGQGCAHWAQRAA